MKKLEKLEHSYLGLRMSDGGALYITGFVMLYLAQIIVIVIFSFFKNENIIDSIWAQYAFMLVNQVAFFFSPLIYGKVVHKSMFYPSRIHKKLNLKQSVLLPFIAMASIMCFLPLAEGFIKVLTLMGYTIPDSGIPLASNWWTMILSLFFVALLPAIGEEFLFRGGVARALKIKSYVFAVIISGLLFGLVHGSAVQFVHQVLIGMIFAFVYFVTGSLAASMITHFTNNAVSIVMGYILQGKEVSLKVLIPVYVTMFIVGFFLLYALLRTLVKVSKDKKSKSHAGGAAVSETQTKIGFKAYFVDLAAAFYPSGIKRNYRKLNNLMQDLFDDPMEEIPTEPDPNDVGEVEDERMKQLLIQSNIEMQYKRRRTDRMSLGIALALSSVVWIINLIVAFMK